MEESLPHNAAPAGAPSVCPFPVRAREARISVLHGETAYRELFPDRRARHTGAELDRPSSLPAVPPPVLLLDASYHGTLAAARCLAARGIEVAVADPGPLTTSGASRAVARRYRCPPLVDTHRLVGWLLEFGARQPGHVLLGTSDGIAWLIAAHAAALSRHFRLYTPGPDAVIATLDKKVLYQEAERAGLGVPETRFPSNLAQLTEIARSASFPLLIKPRTQVLSNTLSKGAIVNRPESLPRRYQAFKKSNRFAPSIVERHPDIVYPMLQAFLPAACESIYALSGFVDRDGTLRALRAARKVLQTPRLLGLGLCYEHAEVEPEAAEKIGALIRALGHIGVFEAELIRHQGRLLLLDFNPRFYGQMAFDIARGAALPLMAYYAAIDDTAALRGVAQQADDWRSQGGGETYCNSFELALMLGAQWISRCMAKDEQRRWRSWYLEHRHRLVDTTWRSDDPVPALVHALVTIARHARRPHRFIENVAFDGRAIF